MPASVVVDASALGAVLYSEAESRVAQAALESKQLLAPTLLPYEIASIGLKKLRRKLIEPADAAAALGMYDAVSITLVPIDPVEVLSLAADKGLSLYDASYCWLARRLDVELITLDRRLAAAAGTTPIGSMQ